MADEIKLDADGSVVTVRTKTIEEIVERKALKEINDEIDQIKAAIDDLPNYVIRKEANLRERLQALRDMKALIKA